MRKETIFALILLKTNFRKIFVILLTLLFSGSCKTSVNPYQYKIQTPDQKKTEFYPSEKELLFLRKKILFLTISNSEDTTQQRRETIMDAVEQAMISESQLTKVLASEEIDEQALTSLSVANSQKLVRFMKKNNADYLNLVSIRILSSEKQSEIDRFRAEILMNIISDVNGKSVVQQKFLFDSEAVEKNIDSFVKFTQLYFSKQGFIIETRGNKKVAQISIGESTGVKKGEKFVIRKRTLNRETQKSSNPLSIKSTIVYSDQIVAEGEVVLLLEDSAWLLLNGQKSGQPELGDVVFGKID